MPPRGKTNKKEEEISEQTVIVKDRLDVMNDILNNAIGALHAANLVDPKRPDLDAVDKLIQGDVESNPIVMDIREKSCNLIVRVLDEYDMLLDEFYES